MLAREWARWLIPEVRVRQWVLSLPLPLRIPLAWHHDLALAVHAIAMRAIEGSYRARALTVIQRFGGDLALNVHFHSLVLDGVDDAAGAFTPIGPPSRAEPAWSGKLKARVDGYIATLQNTGESAGQSQSRSQSTALSL